MNANILDEIWEFGHRFVPFFDEAITEHTGNDPRAEMTLTLTADVDELTEELARFQQILVP